GADVIDDRLPVCPRRVRMAHHPVPQVRILHVQQFVEGLSLRFIGVGKASFQPATEQGVQLAGAAAGAPAQALEACVVQSPRDRSRGSCRSREISAWICGSVRFNRPDICACAFGKRSGTATTIMRGKLKTPMTMKNHAIQRAIARSSWRCGHCCTIRQMNIAANIVKTSPVFHKARGNSSGLNIASILTDEDRVAAYAERRSTISFLISAIALAGFNP